MLVSPVEGKVADGSVADSGDGKGIESQRSVTVSPA
jgi:hypothetical protein